MAAPRPPSPAMPTARYGVECGVAKADVQLDAEAAAGGRDAGGGAGACWLLHCQRRACELLRHIMSQIMSHVSATCRHSPRVIWDTPRGAAGGSPGQGRPGTWVR